MATVLITGANRGIGLAFAHHYLQQGDHVIATCRHSSTELEHTEAEIINGIDVSHPEAINQLKQQLQDVTIDILINNAGIFLNETLGDMDFEQIEQQIRINAIAPLRVVEALQENLATGSKIALITSRMGSIKDNSSGAYYGYRMSKAALNAAGKSLAVDLQPRKISVAILHPGMVSTAMIGFHGDVTPEESVTGLTQRIEQLTLENSGTFWHATGETLPW